MRNLVKHKGRQEVRQGILLEGGEGLVMLQEKHIELTIQEKHK